MASAGCSFKSILCPVDFSSHSRDALRYASAVALRCDGRVTAMFVSDPLLNAAAAAAAYDRRQLAESTDRELERFVVRAVGAGKASLVERRVSEGKAADEIDAVAKRLSADLVVVGTHGLSGANKLFFGSTTERLLQRARVPILAVPKMAAVRSARASARVPSWPGRTGLVPVDVANDSRDEARAAAAVVRELGARPMFVHVVAPPRLPAWLNLSGEGFARRHVGEARARLKALSADAGDGQDGTCRVLVGDPAEQIAALVVDSAIDLVVVVLNRAAGALGPRRGSLTYRILTSGVAPVVALPRDAGKAKA
jgi:nucleotide-binding universal stress UspA family protein